MVKMTEATSDAVHVVRWSGLTDIGRFRENNEDAFLALAVDGEGVRRLGKYGEADLTTNDFIFAASGT